MKPLIAIALGMFAALAATGIEERAMGQASGWLALIVFGSVFTLVLHRLQVQRRHS